MSRMSPSISACASCPVTSRSSPTRLPMPRVSIDESRSGPAPFGPIELQPGEHSVSVRSERFLPFDGVVTVPGLGKHEQVSVQLVPRWSNVEIQSEPSGAKVYSGDEEVGETPTTIELIEGTHQVSVVADGFAAWDGTVVALPERRPVAANDSAAACQRKIARQFDTAGRKRHGQRSLPGAIADHAGPVARHRLHDRPVQGRLRRVDSQGQARRQQPATQSRST